MLIDIIFAILVVLAVIKGYQQGLIMGLFSLIAVIIGLAAALKLSTVVAGYIGKTVKIAEEWLPLISFIIVFIIVILLIRLGAKLIEKTIQVAMLGWLNRLGGAILYATIYILVFSVLLFYIEKMQLVQPQTINTSQAYSFVQPWGPKVINGFGSLVPLFGDMFTELEVFFDKIAQNIACNYLLHIP